MAPTDSSTIYRVIKAMGQHPQGAEVTILGNLKDDLAELEVNGWDEAIAVALMDEGLEDIASHFLPRCLL